MFRDPASESAWSTWGAMNVESRSSAWFDCRLPIGDCRLKKEAW